MFFSWPLMAQIAQPDPVQAVLRDYWKDRTEGRYSEAAARRDRARDLLERMPADSPQFASAVQQVAQLYENGGLHTRAVAVAEDALARVTALGDAHPTRVGLLSMLADFWQQDRNLLKAVGYLEKAAAAASAAPAAAEGPFGGVRMLRGDFPGANRPTMSYRVSGPPGTFLYQRLAEMYRQLGRQQDAAALQEKMRARIAGEPHALAAFLASQGKLDEAAAIYRRQAEQPGAAPQETANAWQALSQIYMRDERYSDAAAALEQAIARIESSGRAEARMQTLWMHMNRANILHQGGDTAAADRIFQQLMSESTDGPDSPRFQVLTGYANYLCMTQRGARAEALLQDYLAGQPDLEPGQQSHISFLLAQASRSAGDTKRAEEYERAAMEKQERSRAEAGAEFLIGRDIQKAEAAIREKRPEEGFNLAMAVMDAAPRATDREQVVWGIPLIAEALAPDAPGNADQLMARLLALVENWAVDNAQPLLEVRQRQARLLITQRRLSEAPRAIQLYRDAVMAARSSDSGWLDEALRMAVELELRREAPESAALAAQELLAFQEAHNGSTSEPYLQALEKLADVYQSKGEAERALALRRQSVALTDQIFPVSDFRRGHARAQLAQALAERGRFDEAEQLMAEAAAITRRGANRGNPFTEQLEHIRRMRKTAETGSTTPSEEIRGVLSTQPVPARIRK